MKSEFLLAFNQICSDRGLSREVVLEALQMALVSAYRRDVDTDTGQNVMAKVDLETGKARIFVEKKVVDEVAEPEQEIALARARAIKSDVEVGEAVFIDDTPDDFGRIAAQSAKQIILQRIREAEREARYAQYVQQEGEIVHGAVQSIKSQVVILHIEGIEAVLPRSQQVPGERYTLHQRLRAYVLEVRKTSRGPQITLSRSHKNMLRRLLELEVPEIFNGAVEIKSIAREAGSRSKVAVAARQPGVDPVGACVGMRGVRIQSIVNELGGEKIDIIEWNPDPAAFIAKALSPARVLGVHLEEDPAQGKTASVIVPDDQLSLAIGRSGQNARLAAKLTGWRIDIQGVTEAATWALQQVNEDPNVLPGLGPAAESLTAVASILRQHEEENLPYTNEELLIMRQVIAGVQNYYTSVRDAERARLMEEEAARRAAIESAKAERRAAIEAVRASIPAEAYEIPLSEMGLSTRVLGHLERAELESVGDVMERSAEGDEGLLKLDGIGPKSLAEIKECLDALELAEEEIVAEEAAEAEEAPPIEPEPEPEALEAVEEEEKKEEKEEEAPPAGALEPVGEALPAEAVEAESVEEEGIVEKIEEVEEGEALLAEPAREETEVEEAEEAEEEGKEEEVSTVEVPETLFEYDEEEEEYGETESESERRERRLRRQLIYDEEAGTVVARRRRKKGRARDEWEDFLDS